jgi:sugar phosphate isomerase/epimerase
MHALCREGSMKLSDWIKLASSLHVEGIEWYAGFLEMQDRKNWPSFKKLTEELGMEIPMMCCSPDFTSPDARFRENEIEKQKNWIDMTASLGGSFCRVLSGQRRPSISIRDGLAWSKECILACIPFAREKGITLILENHYKDDFWEFPEFAQQMEIFCELVNSIEDPGFGVNYDPSNAWLAGDDPIELLKRISSRVVTMHASDRYLKQGSLSDLRNEEMGSTGYAKRLAHGEIGKGLNDYDAIFSELKNAGFSGWISIEDGVDGFDQLERSVAFLKKKIGEYWPIPG